MQAARKWNPTSVEGRRSKSLPNRLEQFSELRDARNSTPHHSILRPAQCFALPPLAKKTLRLSVKCSKPRKPGKRPLYDPSFR
ncbi:hypothetical protein DVJ83_08680 [Deinococcus wulumuqiensis]|uniref:Uncharacterized protein n=1 Tax=Deinococcus wulumuqiensis TaxID=980427 RepID=A0A345IK82_9DEIO|nr:hypothetical protein DVJ83_08680 [Deinococcus wulumuqiensis]